MPYKLKSLLLASSVFALLSSSAQSILPPVMDWNGSSQSLIADKNNKWITPTEASGFVTTPTYNETMSWFKKLTDASPWLHMVSIGKSVEGRDIYMIIASTDKAISATAIKNGKKPVLLVQAGIHSGEIDGKDAGMMLLRDIAFGNKKALLNDVNFLFIPILNVDGHERSGPYNRPNQRGPQNMGWRTNAQNLNLNRDYAKIDTREIRAVIDVINNYDPLLYMDIHVTDGADYQYDITYGWLGQIGYSPAITNWLNKTFKPENDKALQQKGHIPGPLLFALNDRDFSEGNVLSMGGPRFSDSYGNLRHLASVLVENHSLKPFKQRVLGTYVLLENTLKLLAKESAALKAVTAADKAKRPEQVPMDWKIPQMKNKVSFDSNLTLENADTKVSAPDTINFLGIASKIEKSTITNGEYVVWLGKPQAMKVANFLANEPVDFVKRPKAYWVPAANIEVINRLKLHGIQMETIDKPQKVTVEMYKISNPKFEDENGAVKPFEGHMQVSGTTHAEVHQKTFPAGSVKISTDQPLGELAMLLLEPASKDSYFTWGFFNSIFQRTEYIEGYVMEPLAKKMLEESPQLQKEFNAKIASDSKFANNPSAILAWFYSKSKYYDDQYLLYPVGREMQ